MPVYEYACDACQHTFEEWQKVSDPPVRRCPKCGARRVKKLISASGFQFKGEGWYVDGYARKKPAAPAVAPGKASR